MDDKFAITVDHVKSRKKPTNFIETFFAAEYFNAKSKLVAMIDRRSKRSKLIVYYNIIILSYIKLYIYIAHLLYCLLYIAVILETVQDNQPRREHIVAESLDISEPFRNIALIVDQRAQKVEVYVDCKLQGEIPLKRTLKQMAQHAGDLPLEVVSVYIIFFTPVLRYKMISGL